MDSSRLISILILSAICSHFILQCNASPTVLRATRNIAYPTPSHCSPDEGDGKVCAPISTINSLLESTGGSNITDLANLAVVGAFNGLDIINLNIPKSDPLSQQSHPFEGCVATYRSVSFVSLSLSLSLSLSILKYRYRSFSHINI